MSFVEKFNALTVRLKTNQKLTEFCQSRFRRAPKILPVFKERTELQLNDLPVIMVTRPSVRREFAGAVSKKLHSIFLYGGFWTNDREKAPALSIEFEEHLETAIMTRTAHPDDRPMAIMPAETTNDEGKFHPVYFFVMGIEVKDR